MSAPDTRIDVRIDVAVTPPYPVYIGSGLLANTVAGTVAEVVTEQHVALISDEHVAAHYADRVAQALADAGKRCTRFVVASGEPSKSLATFGRLLSEMVEAGFDRGGAVLALGGGVVGDLAGYVAASYMRGVAFYQCPTSLLAMVDASVGGKTGINLPEGKNLVGAFWQPRAVVIDVDTLRTLPAAEFRQGTVELYKHGLLADASILEHVPGPDYRQDAPSDVLADLIGRSVRVKADIVAADEREQGRRAFLNLGHTLAHALEAYSHQDHHPHGPLPHGDAVAYGLLFVAHLAAARGYADETDRIRDFVRWVSPRPLNVSDFGALLPYLARDKKHVGGAQRWVLLEHIGQPTLVSDLREDELRRAWAALVAETETVS
ncbi:MAG: 3-dehydroquinate synthase [Trueperaceae bacterium]|nr:3-dehydroquinate synthase [Trueperaceae bacterium]